MLLCKPVEYDVFKRGQNRRPGNIQLTWKRRSRHSPAPKDGDQLVEYEAEFETVLAQANLPPEVKSSILQLIRTYKADFMSFIVTRQTLRDQVDDLEKIYQRIHPTLMRIVAARGRPFASGRDPC